MINKKIEERVKKIFKDYKVEEDLLDWKSEWDNKISISENFTHISELIEILSSSISQEDKSKADFKRKKKSIKSEKEEIDRVKFEASKKEIEITQKEFNKSLKNLKENNSVLEKLYWLPKEYVKVVINPNNEIYGLIFFGKAGISKSYSTIQTLNETKSDYVYFAGYTTPLGLYQFLYENKDNKVIVFDDTFGILNNLTSITIMLNALYSNTEKRKINWKSSKLKDLPPEFILNSNVILITNKLPKNIEVDLINSRCLTYEFKFNNFEILAIMRAIANLKHPKLSKEERQKIVVFIEKSIDEATINFDLRIQNKIENLYLYDKEKWQDLSMPLLNTKNEKLVLLKKFLNECATLSDAKKEFQEAGLGGERTFQRINKRLKEATIRQGF